MQESMEDSIAAEPEFHRCNSENHRLGNAVSLFTSKTVFVLQ